MTREEFMELLDYYFRNVRRDVYEEIRKDYEEHFEVGLAKGQSEEEISRMLGSPKQIYQACLDEGVFEESDSLSDMMNHWFQEVNSVFSGIRDRVFWDKEENEDSLRTWEYQYPKDIHRLELQFTSADVFLLECPSRQDIGVEVQIYGEEDEVEISLVDSTLAITESKKTLRLKEKKALNYINSRVAAVKMYIPQGSDFNISCQLTSGDFILKGGEHQINVLTTSGDVDINTRGQVVNVKTVSGDIELDSFSGSLSFNTVSGDVDLETSQSVIRGATVSGDVQLKGKNLSFAKLNSTSGDLLIVDDSFNGDFEGQSVSGSLDIDGGGLEVESGFGKKIKKRTGPGNNKIEAKTVSGDIRFKGQD